MVPQVRAHHQVPWDLGVRQIPADQDKDMCGVGCTFTHTHFHGALSPLLIGRMFVREPSWKHSVNIVGS